MFTILVCDPGQVEAEVDRSIEATVANLVEEELDKFIPKEIRQKADEQQLHIQQLHIQIHNSLSTPARTHPATNQVLIGA